jgi:DNA-binding MltR family transcriptional regulator
MADDIMTTIRNLEKAFRAQKKRAHPGFVITGAAILDSQLERALKKAMRPLPKKTYERIFEPFGPLSNFASKIIIAYAFGIISAEIYEKLEMIRKLRNKISHSSMLLDLESNEIAPLLSALDKTPQAKTDSLRVFMECIREIDAALDTYLDGGEPHQEENS